MNEIRLKDMAKNLTWLAQQQTHNFHLTWFYHGDKEPTIDLLKEPNCGTTACAVGYLPYFYPNVFKWSRSTDEWNAPVVKYIDETLFIENDMGVDASTDWFDITEEQWEYLFEPGSYKVSELKNPLSVVKHINYMLENDGDVDFSESDYNRCL